MRMRAAGACCEDAGGDHAAVVEDEEVAFVQIVREVSEGVIFEGAGGALYGEHAAGAADGGRGLGDEVFGKREVEVGDEHEALFVQCFEERAAAKRSTQRIWSCVSGT